MYVDRQYRVGDVWGYTPTEIQYTTLIVYKLVKYIFCGYLDKKSVSEILCSFTRTIGLHLWEEIYKPIGFDLGKCF